MFGLCVKVSVINTSSVLFVLVSDKLDLYDSPLYNDSVNRHVSSAFFDRTCHVRGCDFSACVRVGIVSKFS